MVDAKLVQDAMRILLGACGGNESVYCEPTHSSLGSTDHLTRLSLTFLPRSVNDILTDHLD